MTTELVKEIMTTPTFNGVQIGDVFPSKYCGKFEVVRKISGKYPSIEIMFLDTGYRTVTQFKNVKGGSVKDKLMPSRFGVGYVGVGSYKLRCNGVVTKAASQWKHMLERCYSSKFQERFPNYRGCSVVEGWHNFQEFAKWHYENYPDDGKAYELDKDNIIPGNKIYGPDSCCFLSKKDNIQISKQKEWKFISPEGVVISFCNLNEFCRNNGLVRENMGKVYRGERAHCSGWTKYIDK